MAKKYKSKPHNIDAFRFSVKTRAYPEWFTKAIHEGKASLTINNKSRYISIYGKDQEEKAYTDDWVCLSNDGKLYVLPDDIFQKYYEAMN